MLCAISGASLTQPPVLPCKLLTSTFTLICAGLPSGCLQLWMYKDEASLPTAAPAPGQDDIPAQPTEADLQALDIYSVVAKVRKHDEDPRSSGVVKRYRKQSSASDSAPLSVHACSHPPMASSCKAPPPKPCPLALGAPPLGDPPFKVSDLPHHTGSVCSRPRFTVKYPAHRPGTPQPPPVFSKKHSIAAGPPALGGKPCPDLRWDRKSISQLPAKSAFATRPPFSLPLVCSAKPPALKVKSLCVPQARAPYMVTAASLAEPRRQKSQDQFSDIVKRIGEHCDLRAILASSKHPQAHVQQLLAAYAVNTLYRYLSCCFTFVDFRHAQQLCFSLVPVALMVDFLHAAAASKQQDRALHRASTGTAIKSLRWLAKHAQWHALAACMHNALVAAYAKQIDSYDKKRRPYLYLLHCLWPGKRPSARMPRHSQPNCSSEPPCSARTRASICFGDAQRVKWGSIQLSSQGLHAVAYATKTTKRGQPFACTWHGISGRDTGSSWLLHWLAALAQLPRNLFAAEERTHEPDFLFPHIDMQSLSVPFLAPASYARTLLCIRWAAQDAGISQHARLNASEASALTLHSMKSTALALAAQLHLPREDRLSQGHHRDSAKLYSRNDSFASLRVQRHICTQVASGWRPLRSMARGGAAPVPEPPSNVSEHAPPQHLPAASLLQGPWRIFTSRHETMHAADEPAQPTPELCSIQQEDNVLVAGSDSEAEEVELFAQTATADSDSNADEAQQAQQEDSSMLTYVCSGPWGRMHVPTTKSLQAYLLALPQQGSLAVCKLKASCGARLGAASFVAVCKEPVSLCRRKACIAARHQGT